MNKSEDFKKGVKFALEYIEKNLTGHVINRILVGAITEYDFEKIKKEIFKDLE